MAIILPRRLATEAGLSPGITVDMSAHEAGILVRRRTTPRRSIEQIVEEIDASAYARHRESADDKPVGKEVW